MKNFLSAVLLFFSTVVYAQINPSIVWEEALGSANSEEAYSIQLVPTGGFIVAGSAGGNGGDVQGFHGVSDFWIVRLDDSGAIKWAKCYGGSGYDDAYSIQNTRDGGFVIAGETTSPNGDVTGYHGGFDYWVIKIDSIGNLQWESAYGGRSDEVAQSVAVTKDGGYVIAGNTQSYNGDVHGNHGGFDCWIIKLDSTGKLQWSKCYGGTSGDAAFSIIATKDGGSIFAANSSSNNDDVTGHHGTAYDDYWIVKIDSRGNIIWEKSFGGTGEDTPNSIAKTNDGNYVVAGYTNSTNDDITKNHGSNDYWVIEIDSNGNLLNQVSLGGPRDEYATSIAATRDGGYVVNGYADSKFGEVTGLHHSQIEGALFDAWVVKLNYKLRLDSEMCLGGTGEEYGYGIVQTKNGGYTIAASATSEDGDVTGFHNGINPEFPDYWIVKLKPKCFRTVDATREDEVNTNSNDFNIYPTIFNSTFTLTLQTTTNTNQLVYVEVFNLYGQLVTTRQYQISNSILDAQVQLDAALPKGLYFVRASMGVKGYLGKVVKE